MGAYTLQLRFSSQDLKTIAQAGESVVVAKAFSDSATNVAWVVFTPFENNFVSWDEAYAFFASPAQSSGTVQILSASQGTALSGRYYTFDGTGFEGPYPGETAPPAGSFRVINQVPSQQYPALGFGLLQSATVNGEGFPSLATNQEIVPAAQYATFTPLETVYVWLQSGVRTGAIVTLPPAAPRPAQAVAGFATEIQFAGPSTLTYSYDASTGTFFPSH